MRETIETDRERERGKKQNGRNSCLGGWGKNCTLYIADM